MSADAVVGIIGMAAFGGLFLCMCGFVWTIALAAQGSIRETRKRNEDSR